MSKNKTPHYIESPMHAAMIDLRHGNAAQPHDSRPKRERSRKDSKRAAIKRSSED